MTREQLIETINQTAYNVWSDNEMILEVGETQRGYWEIRLDNVRQYDVPTAALLYAVRAMITTALRHKPATPAMKERKKEEERDLYKTA